MVAVLVAGCSFDVIGTNVGDPTGGGTGSTPSPTQSVPDGPDAGLPATTPTPTPTPTVGPDMAMQRIGTACTSDAQCDPGLLCAKSFGAGPGRVDIPGGYCTLDCSKGPCPANSFCETFTFGKYCLSDCPPDTCRGAGYVCCNYSGGNHGCAPTALCPRE
jgi:hypothetical protein